VDHKADTYHLVEAAFCRSDRMDHEGGVEEEEEGHSREADSPAGVLRHQGNSRGVNHNGALGAVEAVVEAPSFDSHHNHVWEAAQQDNRDSLLVAILVS
jgi:hypothetical protein